MDNKEKALKTKRPKRPHIVLPDNKAKNALRDYCNKYGLRRKEGQTASDAILAGISQLEKFQNLKQDIIQGKI